MKTFFARIVGLCPVLDGIRVEAIEEPSGGDALLQIVRFSGAPITEGMWIYSSYLERLVEVPEEELGLDNPFGSFIETDAWADGEGIVHATRYLYATHINIKNTRNNRTLVDQVFWGEKAEVAWDAFKNSQLQPGHEPLDFAFEIKEI